MLLLDDGNEFTLVLRSNCKYADIVDGVLLPLPDADTDVETDVELDADIDADEDVDDVELLVLLLLSLPIGFGDEGCCVTIVKISSLDFRRCFASILLFCLNTEGLIVVVS